MLDNACLKSLSYDNKKKKIEGRILPKSRYCLQLNYQGNRLVFNHELMLFW